MATGLATGASLPGTAAPSGTTNEATPVSVSPGDQIEGYSFSTCGKGTKTCPTWDVVALDDQNESFLLSSLIRQMRGRLLTGRLGGVLEVYNITQCSDYPAGEESGYGGKIGFHDQVILNDQYVQINPSWTISNVSGD